MGTEQSPRYKRTCSTSTGLFVAADERSKKNPQKRVSRGGPGYWQAPPVAVACSFMKPSKVAKVAAIATRAPRLILVGSPHALGSASVTCHASANSVRGGRGGTSTRIVTIPRPLRSTFATVPASVTRAPLQAAPISRFWSFVSASADSCSTKSAGHVAPCAAVAPAKASAAISRRCFRIAAPLGGPARRIRDGARRLVVASPFAQMGAIHDRC